MTRLGLISPLVLALGFTSLSTAMAQNITYFVWPYTLTDAKSGDEYTLSGTITTNGTLGTLAATDITDFQITVNGSRPYTFLPSTASMQFYVAGLNATESVIQVLSAPEVDDFLAFYVRDNASEDCTNCGQHVWWGNQPNPNSPDYRGLEFGYRDTRDDNPWVTAAIVRESGSPILIAEVPEPSTRWLSAMGVMGAFGLLRSRYRNATGGGRLRIFQGRFQP